MTNNGKDATGTESVEARDARLLLGAAKKIVGGAFLFLGVIGAIAAPIVARLLTPEQIEALSLWVIIPAGFCILVYFFLVIRCWWIREYRDASDGAKPSGNKVE